MPLLDYLADDNFWDKKKQEKRDAQVGSAEKVAEDDAGNYEEFRKCAQQIEQLYRTNRQGKTVRCEKLTNFEIQCLRDLWRNFFVTVRN